MKRAYVILIICIILTLVFMPKSISTTDVPKIDTLEIPCHELE